MLASILASVWTIVLIILGIVTAVLIVTLGVMLVIEMKEIEGCKCLTGGLKHLI